MRNIDGGGGTGEGLTVRKSPEVMEGALGGFTRLRVKGGRGEGSRLGRGRLGCSCGRVLGGEEFLVGVF